MLPYKYAYIIGCIYVSIVWLILFLKRPLFRFQILSLSSMGLFIGPLTNYLFFTRDWWNPLNITNTPIGIEDALMGFSTIGIASFFYTFFSKKNTNKKIVNFSHLIILICITFIPFLIAFYYFHLHSLFCNVIGFSSVSILMIIKKKGNLKIASITAFAMPFIFAPAFWIPEIIFPGIIQKVWLFQYLSGISILHIPIEDIVWYMCIGFTISMSYDYIFQTKD